MHLQPSRAPNGDITVEAHYRGHKIQFNLGADGLGVLVINDKKYKNNSGWGYHMVRQWAADVLKLHGFPEVTWGAIEETT